MVTAVLVSMLFVSGVSLVLAALLVIAERTILDYGVCAIDINDGDRRLEVRGGSSLLSLLAENGIFIPSACGGRGSCAYCKVAVREGGGAVGPVEEPYLTPEDKKEGVRLSCQVRVRGDMRIAIPRELFLVKRFTAVCEKKTPLTPDIVQLTIRLREPAEMEFIAGQYVQLDSPPYTGHEAVSRAYSISSPPSRRDAIELVIRLVPGGICTTWVFEHLRENDRITLSGPYGEFRLSDTEAPMIFIAGGSGMAPIWSMLRDMRHRGITHRRTTYFFGALTREDLFYTDELRAMERECDWFEFVPALSREPEGSEWRGERGLITEAVARRFPDTSGHEAYLCGSPGMIDACVKVLTAGGIPGEKIYYDKFA